jgi:hypothetical protein
VQDTYVELEILTAVAIKSSIFWDIAPCSPLKINRRFGGTYHLHIQALLKLSWPHDVVFFNVGRLSTDYTVLHPRKQNSPRPAIIIFISRTVLPVRWNFQLIEFSKLAIHHYISIYGCTALVGLGRFSVS